MAQYIRAKPRFTDTHFIGPFWWRVCFVPGKRKPYIFSKLNPLNTDRIIITGFDCLDFLWRIWRERRGISPRQSCPLTFKFVPTGLSSYVYWSAFTFFEAQKDKINGQVSCRQRDLHYWREKVSYRLHSMVKIRIFVTYRIKEILSFIKVKSAV